MAGKDKNRLISRSSNISPEMYSKVLGSIVEIKGIPVIADADVAALYGVETRRVNEAVKNSPDKFPNDYMFELVVEDVAVLRSKISTTKVFTEKGLYMLATVLKSKQATNVSFAYI